MGEISIIADLNSLYFNLFPPTFKQFFSISNFISLFEEKKKEKIATPSPLLRILRVHGSRCREQAGNRNNARKIYAAGAKREIPPNIYIYISSRMAPCKRDHRRAVFAVELRTRRSVKRATPRSSFSFISDGRPAIPALNKPSPRGKFTGPRILANLQKSGLVVPRR